MAITQLRPATGLKATSMFFFRVFEEMMDPTVPREIW